MPIETALSVHLSACLYVSINLRTAEQTYIKSHTRELSELCQWIPHAVTIGQYRQCTGINTVPEDSPVCKSLHTYKNKKCFKKSCVNKLKVSFHAQYSLSVAWFLR